MPEFSAHGIVDNLQLVFPEIGRTIDRPKERSEQKAVVATTNHASPDPGKCPQQTAVVATSD